ncbi:MAG: 50S ribosomal protein L20 [Phycisphaerae bacterium]|nr:50S ribosomal protein L20 [Phycisphaerae bacterium]
MPRVRKGAATRQSKNRVLKSAKGFYGLRHANWRIAKQAVDKAQQDRRIGLRVKKRTFRGLWITRVSAACQQRGLRYSQFIAGLNAAGIQLNRKMLSELAIHDPAAFDAVVAKVQAALAG